MLVFAMLLAILFIILILALPFAFKIALKMEGFAGYCKGLCCICLIGLVLLIILLIELLGLAEMIKDDTERDTPDLSAFSNIDYIKDLSFKIRFFIWLVDLVDKLAIFLVIFCYEGKFSSIAPKNNSIFMFLSGFLFPFTIMYAFYAAIAYGSDELSEWIAQRYDSDTGKAIEDLTTSFIVGSEFTTAALMVLYSGTIIMIWLHKKKLSSFIIWICVGCFFGPLIIEFIGICGVDFFYTYLVPISYIASPICGAFFYYKLNNDDNIPTQIADQSPLV